MMRNALALENRIHKLTERDPVGNHKIIQKLKRQLRKVEIAK